jgi:hypothetical protein
VGRLLRGLGLVTKRHSEGYYVDLEASSEAIKLIEKQYDVAGGTDNEPPKTKDQEKVERMKQITGIE